MPDRLTASSITDDALTALYERAEQAESDVARWLAFIERGMTTHMQFSVLRDDGTTEQLPCADWCHACRVEQAEAAIARVRKLCELTIAASVRVQAIDQARDTLAALDGTKEQ